ncbi:helix-turn-helix domain-containing protein [Nonomuraea sp. NPDC050556]|uniref:helix-turn-helix domain-containing protein n=1 Tax=Nonomuraea sp. NPDC050556 TaxID=3364369 RepID=UPI0037B55CB1
MDGQANGIKRRRSELRMTQQEAARRAGVSLATWRRFENETSSAADLDAFRGETTKGFARTLGVAVTELRHLVDSDAPHPSTDPHEAAIRRTVEQFNQRFNGDPLTPQDAMALAQTVMFSDFAPTTDGKYSTTGALSVGFSDYLKGETVIDEVPLLCDLPGWVLIQVNDHWLSRMGECIMRIGDEIAERVRVPSLRCIADEVAMSIVIMNSDPPRLGDCDEMYPGLLGSADIFGYDPDLDDADDDDAEYRREWLNRIMGGMLPSDSAHGQRGLKLAMLNFYEQGVYDPNDPLHPLRWFDRDDLRGRFEQEMAALDLPAAEREARSREALERVSATLFPTNEDA